MPLLSEVWTAASPAALAVTGGCGERERERTSCSAAEECSSLPHKGTRVVGVECFPSVASATMAFYSP